MPLTSDPAASRSRPPQEDASRPANPAANPPGAPAARRGAIPDKPRHLTDLTRSWHHGRNPVFFSLALLVAAFLNSRIHEDTFSPILEETQFLERLCAETPGPGPRNLILILGSSYPRTDCDNHALEARLAAGGYPEARVFTVSVPSFDSQGTDKILERVLQVPGLRERISLVVLDHSLPAQRASMRHRAGGVPQLWLLGDVSQFVTSCRLVLNSKAPREEKIAVLRERAHHFVKANFQTGLIGSGLRLFSRSTVHREEKGHPFSVVPFEQTQGFAALEGTSDRFRNPSGAEWEKRTAAYRRFKASPPPLDDVEAGILRSPVRRVLDDPGLKDAGVISVLFPSLWTDIHPQHVAAAIGDPIPENVVIADFSRPAAYPEFFRFEHLYDRRHLNATGAELLAGRMAETILELYARKPGLYAGAPGRG